MITSVEADIVLADDEADVRKVLTNITESGLQEDPFYIFEVGDIIRKYSKWIDTLPRVTPFYAVKCNDHPFVLSTLATLGAGFDCASKDEIRKVLALGVDRSRMIFANPTKLPSHIEYARNSGVNLLTFDNEIELRKIKISYPTAKLVLRIRSDASVAQYRLGNKFGCDIVKEAPVLLRLARSLDLNVVGISFHVGSRCGEPAAYRRSIAAACVLFELGRNLGFQMELLDIGGGYPGLKGSFIDEVANIINTALDEYFPIGCGVKVIAEPGRYFVESAFTLAAVVHSKRQLRHPDQPDGSVFNFYYIGVGIYSSFDDAVHDPQSIRPVPLNVKSGRQLIPCSIWGPVCNDIDRIVSNVQLPDLSIGDWLIFKNMGAYSLALAGRFSSTPVPKVCAIANRFETSMLDNLISNGQVAFREAPLPVVNDRNQCTEEWKQIQLHPLFTRLSDLCEKIGLWRLNMGGT